MTTRLTFFSLEAALSIHIVPATALSMKSAGFSTFQWNGDAVWMMALRSDHPPTQHGSLHALGSFIECVVLPVSPAPCK